MAQVGNEAKLAAVNQFFEVQQWLRMKDNERLEVANTYHQYRTMQDQGLPATKPCFVLFHDLKKQIADNKTTAQRAAVLTKREEEDEPTTSTNLSVRVSTPPFMQILERRNEVKIEQAGTTTNTPAVEQQEETLPEVGVAPQTPNLQEDDNSEHDVNPVAPEAGNLSSPPVNSGVTSDGDLPSLLDSDSKQQHKCPTCDKGFKRPAGLKLHIATVHKHSAGSQQQCPSCNKIFVDKPSLALHYMAMHEGGNYECDQCGKEFSQKSLLKNHEMIHKGIRPFMCDICGKAFRQSTSLDDHRRLHLQIQCPYCDARFVTTIDMNDHVKHTHPFMLMANHMAAYGMNSATYNNN